MGSGLANVRLDEERLRKVRKLRQSGVTLSELVRTAIDERFEGLQRSRQPRDVDAIIDSILQQHPDPPDQPARSYDVHDRRQARDAIRRKLRRRRR